MNDQMQHITQKSFTLYSCLMTNKYQKVHEFFIQSHCFHQHATSQNQISQKMKVTNVFFPSRVFNYS